MKVNPVGDQTGCSSTRAEFQVVARKGVILVGLGEMAIMLAGRLDQVGQAVVLVGQDGGRERGIRQANLAICEGDPTSPSILAAALVAMSGSDEVNRVTCRLAAEQFAVCSDTTTGFKPDGIKAYVFSLVIRIPAAAILQMIV